MRDAETSDYDEGMQAGCSGCLLAAMGFFIGGVAGMFAGGFAFERWMRDGMRPEEAGYAGLGWAFCGFWFGAVIGIVLAGSLWNLRFNRTPKRPRDGSAIQGD